MFNVTFAFVLILGSLIGFWQGRLPEAAVVASPDQVRGNVIKAFVVLRKGFEPSEVLIKDLQDYAKANLEPYKYPRKIEFVESKELPRTQSGKIMHRELAEREKKSKGVGLKGPAVKPS